VERLRANERGPVLVRFGLDMNRTVLSLEFSETVNGSSLRPQTIVLQSVANLSSSGSDVLSLQLSGGVVSGGFAAVQHVALLQVDSDLLKALPGLATSRANTFLSFTADLVANMNGIDSVAVSSEQAQQAQQYIADGTAPQLLDARLDLSNGTLVLSFSETVNASTLVSSRVVLQNRMSGADSTLALALSQRRVGSALYATEVVIVLSFQELNTLRVQQSIATSRSNAFVRVQATGVADMQGNRIADTVVAISGFAADVVAPRLLSFNVSMNLGHVDLLFDKTVNVSAVNVRGLGLQDNATAQAGQLVLSGAQSVVALNGLWTAVRVVLLKTDLDGIKAQYMCSSRLNCFVTVGSWAVQDMSGNAVQAVVDGAAAQAEVFVADVTAPQLVGFVQLDKNTGRLTLSFDEPMDPMGFDLTRLGLFDMFVRERASLRLSGGRVLSNRSSLQVIELLASDLNSLKRLSLLPLCTNINNCYLRLNSTFARDIAGNAVTAVSGGVSRTMRC